MHIMWAYQLQKQGAAIIHHVFCAEGLKLCPSISFLLTLRYQDISAVVYMMHILFTSEVFIFKLKYKNNLKSHICEPIFAFSLILK